MPHTFTNLCGLSGSEVSSITKHLCYWLIFQQPPTKTSWLYGKCCSSQFGKCGIQHHTDMQIFQKQKPHSSFPYCQTFKQFIQFHISSEQWVHQSVQGGADKSLTRPTSQRCRMESIVSLERGVCSCAELQVFSCYRG